MPEIARKAKWANKKRGRQPAEWVEVVDGVWKGFDIDERKTLEIEGLEGFKEEIPVAFARREKQNLAEEIKVKAGSAKTVFT